MKRQHLVIAAALAVLTMPLLAACGDGGDNGGPGEVRTESGLGVALVAANADLARGSTGQSDQGGAVAPGGAVSPGDAYGAERAPVLQQTPNGITVSGYGTAAVDADNAVVEFNFGSYGDAVRPDEPAEPGSSGGESADRAASVSAAAITEEDLLPVIDALVGAGVDRDDIELLGATYYYDAYWYSATLRVTVRDLDILGDAVGAATDASLDLTGISLQGTYISYVVEDCAPLEEAALSAAVEDAQARADVFAAALGVTRGVLIGAQTFAYSPFGGSPCGVSNIGPYPVAEAVYSESRANDVTLYADVTLTYSIE
jgi:uncharacterized protein YggE